MQTNYQTDAVAFFNYVAANAVSDEKSISELVASDKGYIGNGEVYVEYTAELHTLMEKAVAAVYKTPQFTPHNMAESEIEHLLRQSAADQYSSKTDQFGNFKTKLESAIAKDIKFIGPNYAVFLANDVKSFDIGPVKILKSKDLKDDYPDDLGTIDFHIFGTERDKSHKYDPFVTVPQYCFHLDIFTNPKKVREIAEWQIEIAVSLLRLFIIKTKKINGYFPYAGDVELALFYNSEPAEGHIAVNKTDQNRTPGNFGRLPEYDINAAVVYYLKQAGFDKACSKVFADKPDSIVPSLQRALGWMTKARQTKNLATRYIFFSTALEALLSPSKGEPLVDVLSRNVATMLASEVQYRSSVARTFKDLYDIRSTLIHAGETAVLKSQCKKMQVVTEKVCLAVIEHCLDQTSKEFKDDLKEASFGVEWPIKREGLSGSLAKG